MVQAEIAVNPILVTLGHFKSHFWSCQFFCYMKLCLQCRYFLWNLATGSTRTTSYAGRLSMFTSHKIEGIVSERAYSVSHRTIISNTCILRLLIFHNSIDTKQVKQQWYSEKRYPIKSFTVPSKTNNKVIK